jgi:hypothetical protein
MPWAGFEPTILVFERAKTVYALDRAATVISVLCNYAHIILVIVAYNIILLICVRNSTRFQTLVFIVHDGLPTEFLYDAFF